MHPKALPFLSEGYDILPVRRARHRIVAEVAMLGQLGCFLEPYFNAPPSPNEIMGCMKEEPSAPGGTGMRVSSCLHSGGCARQ